MRRAIGRLVVAGVALHLCAVACEAQIGRIWSPVELLAESDLVAICEHLEMVATGVKTLHPELRPGLPVMEVKSRLRLLASLKGNLPGLEISILHYWLDWERLPGGVVNAGTELRLGEASGPFLGFVREAPDGSYSPTTGYTFADGSFMRLVKMEGRATTR